MRTREGALDKAGPKDWLWTLMLVHPAFVSSEHFSKAVEEGREKDPPGLGMAHLTTFDEGLRVQTMQIGPLRRQGLSEGGDYLQALSKSSVRLSLTTRIILLVLLALVALSDPALTVVFFIPIAGWFLWRDHERISELEKRLAEAEKPPQPKPEEAPPLPS